jgi:hypothetical protein
LALPKKGSGEEKRRLTRVEILAEALEQDSIQLHFSVDFQQIAHADGVFTLNLNRETSNVSPHP